VSGDADISAIASLFSDRGRSSMLLALGDGRALAASTLAAEAGVAPSTASRHLSLLLDAGLVSVEPHGRHRYYRLAGPEVGELIEALARLAPAAEVRSLREGTRAHALRAARTCYDHLAGRLGTDLMAALLADGLLAGGDGLFRPGGEDRLSAPGCDVDYRLTGRGRRWLAAFGVEVTASGSRPLVRYCLDWSEQRHHLAGALGSALLTRFFDLRWLERAPTGRSLRVTGAGRSGLAETFGLELGGSRRAVA
jgi:DNA-binding transcriptional ArsR family regulator